MARFRLTVRAELDLLEIAAYTQRTWDEDQCARYLDLLEQACEHLADHPGLGRACDHIRPGLHRSERGSHVIFCRRSGEDIVVVRILHKRMLPDLHCLDDDDEDAK